MTPRGSGPNSYTLTDEEESKGPGLVSIINKDCVTQKRGLSVGHTVDNEGRGAALPLPTALSWMGSRPQRARESGAWT